MVADGATHIQETGDAEIAAPTLVVELDNGAHKGSLDRSAIHPPFLELTSHLVHILSSRKEKVIGDAKTGLIQNVFD